MLSVWGRLELPAQLQRGERVEALAGQRRVGRHARPHQLGHHAPDHSLKLRRGREAPTVRCLPRARRCLRAHGAARLAGRVGWGRPAGKAALRRPGHPPGPQDRREHSRRARWGAPQQRAPVCAPRRAAHARVRARGAQQRGQRGHARCRRKHAQLGRTARRAPVRLGGHACKPTPARCCRAWALPVRQATIVLVTAA